MGLPVMRTVELVNSVFPGISLYIPQRRAPHARCLLLYLHPSISLPRTPAKWSPRKINWVTTRLVSDPQRIFPKPTHLNNRLPIRVNITKTNPSRVYCWGSYLNPTYAILKNSKSMSWTRLSTMFTYMTWRYTFWARWIPRCMH